MKTTPEQRRAALAEMHVKAGARYAAAALELLNAWSDFLAIGEAASNRNIGAIAENDRLASVHPRVGTHPTYLPSIPNNDLLLASAHARAAELITDFYA